MAASEQLARPQTKPDEHEQGSPFPLLLSTLVALSLFIPTIALFTELSRQQTGHHAAEDGGRDLTAGSAVARGLGADEDDVAG